MPINAEDSVSCLSADREHKTSNGLPVRPTGGKVQRLEDLGEIELILLSGDAISR